MLRRILLGGQAPRPPDFYRGPTKGMKNMSAWSNGRRERLRFRVGGPGPGRKKQEKQQYSRGRGSRRIEFSPIWQRNGEHNKLIDRQNANEEIRVVNEGGLTSSDALEKRKKRWLYHEIDGGR